MVSCAVKLSHVRSVGFVCVSESSDAVTVLVIEFKAMRREYGC